MYTLWSSLRGNVRAVGGQLNRGIFWYAFILGTLYFIHETLRFAFSSSWSYDTSFLLIYL